MSKKNRILEAVHETAKDLHSAGVIDLQTMRELDALCLPKVRKYTPEQIKLLRRRNKVSQAVFAAYLNTTSISFQQWEQGKKSPNGTSLKLLNLVDKKGLDILA